MRPGFGPTLSLSRLNAAAIKVAKAIGPIHFSDGDKKCEPMNVLKHLTSDYLRNKLGV